MTGEEPQPQERGPDAPRGWLPPAPGSDWRVAPAPGAERYEGFAPPRPGPPAPASASDRDGGAAAPPAATPRDAGPQAPVNGKAIASVVLGVCGLVVLPLLASVAAIVLGSLARGEILRGGATRGTRLASAGIILGVVGIVLWIAIVAVNTRGRA